MQRTQRSLVVAGMVLVVLLSATAAASVNDFMELLLMGDEEAIREAIRTDWDVNTRGEDGETPLMVVMGRERVTLNLVNFLLAEGADAQARDVDGWTPLLWAAIFGADVTIMQRLLEAGAEVNARDAMGWTPLMAAAEQSDDPAVLRFLLAAEAQVNVADRYGRTPLMLASAATLNPEVVKVLLEAGAEPDARDEDGWTPLMYAATFSTMPQVLAVLLDAGAGGHFQDVLGRTAFDLAAENPFIQSTQVFWRLNEARF